MVELYSRVGEELLVNTTTTGAQAIPHLEWLANGGFVAIWMDASAAQPDGVGTTIRGQRFDANGNKLGGEFLASSATGLAYWPKVTELASGRLVVTWTEMIASNGDGSGFSVKGQLLEADGTKVGSEFLVNTTTASSQQLSTVTELGNGGFVIAWADTSAQGNDTSSSAIKAQLFNASATKIGGEFLVNTTTTGSQSTPALATLSDGGFVVTWTDNSASGGDTSSSAVRMQRFDVAGVKVGSETLVNTVTAGFQNSSNVAALTGGKFLVTWADGSGQADSSGAGLKGQIFDSAGAKVGAELQINTSTAGDQRFPRIGALADGGFIVTWDSPGSGAAAGTEIRAQIFDNTGGKVGAEFTVNSDMLGSQSEPTVIQLVSGEIVIAWVDQNPNGDGSGSSIRAQIIDQDTVVPSDIVLSSNSVSETSLEQIGVATLTTNGGINSGYTYTIVSDSTVGAFQVVGDKLIVVNNDLLDFETAPTAQIRVRSTDANGAFYEKDIQINIADSPEGQFVGSNEFIVHGDSQLDRASPAITPLASGGFVAFWQETSQPAQGGSFVGRGQVFDSSGVKVGAEINFHATSVAGLASGGFVTTRVSSDGEVVYAQLFTAGGAPTGAELTVSPPTSGFKYFATVAGLSSGGFVVTWSHATGFPADSEVRAQIYDGNGNKLGSTIAITGDLSGNHEAAAVVGLESGRFVVVWRDGTNGSIKGQTYANSGERIGSEFNVNTITGNMTSPRISALPGGGFAVVWSEVWASGMFSGEDGIRMHIFDSSGAKVGNEIRVTDGGPGAIGSFDVATLSSGAILVTWTADDAPYTGSLRAQLFDATGARIGSEFGLNGGDFGDQLQPQVIGLDSDRFLAVWAERTDSSSSTTGIEARIFTQGDPQPDNDAPIVTTSPGATEYVEGANSQAEVAIDVAIGLIDPDNSDPGAITSARIQISGNYHFGEDFLSLPSGFGGTGIFDANSGRLTITANGQLTTEQWRQMIGNVRYINTSDTPSTEPRTLTILVSDGTDWSAPATKTITITPVDDAPVADLDPSQPGIDTTTTYEERAEPRAIMSTATVVDADTNSYGGGALRIERFANNSTDDSLGIQSQGRISVSGNVVSFDGVAIGTFTGGGAGDLVISLNAAADPFSVIFLMRAVTYYNPSANPQNPGPIYKVTLSDGNGLTSGPAYVNVAINQWPDPTLFDFNGSADGTVAHATYEAGSAPVAIAPDAVLTDPDTSNFSGRTLTASFVNPAASDTLSVLVGGPIGIDGNNVTYQSSVIGQLDNVSATSITISLTAQNVSLAALQALVRAFGFSNPASDLVSQSRTISFQLTGGSDGSLVSGGLTELSTTNSDDPPTAVADTASVETNATTTIAVLLNDTDPDGGPKSVAAIAGSSITAGSTLALASGARVTLNWDGTLTYDPNGAIGAGATDVFGYTLNGGSSANVMVNILAGGGGDTPPTAVTDTASVAANATTTIAVLLNDTDPDGGPKAVATIAGSAASVGVPVTLASGARVTLNADGTLTYDPNGAVGVGSTDNFSYALNGGSSATVSVSITAGSSNGILLGSPAADTMNGGAGADSFNLGQGGTDQVAGAGGNDGIYFGAAFGPGDVVDGGAGTDTLALQGNYSSQALNGVSGVEVLLTASGSDTRFGDTANNRYDYNIATVDANVGAGGTLTVIASELLAGEDLIFSGAAETDGQFRIFAGRGTDQLTGGAGGDGFFFGADGNLTGADRVNGGAGIDSIALRGNYVGATAIVFLDASFTNVEVLTFLSGHTNEFGGAINLGGFDYDVTLANGIVAAGQRLDVIAGNLRANESARVDARAELDGSVRIISGAGDDILFGSVGNDILSGGLGADVLDGSSGSDSYVYRSAAESTSASRDTIAFGSGDKIDLSMIDANGGTPSNESFSFIGAAAFSNVAGQLRAVQSGNQWIIEGDVNGDGTADLVIAVTSAAPLTTSDFIL